MDDSVLKIHNYDEGDGDSATLSLIHSDKSIQLVPNAFQRMDDTDSLYCDIEALKAKKNVNEKVIQFYENQNSHLDDLVKIDSFRKEKKGFVPSPPNEHQPSSVRNAIILSFGCTLFLICLKTFIAIYSGSIAVISTAVDSGLDVLSQGTMLVTSRIMSRHDPLQYPFGKSRLEPLSLVVFACVMGMAALQLLSEAIRALVEGLSSPEYPTIKMDAITISGLALTICIQLGFWVYCRQVQKLNNDNPSAGALADDHINDVCINLIGGIPAIIAGFFPFLWFLDSTGAILLSIYIAVRWTGTCLEQFGSIVGVTAPSNLISQIVYLAANHSSDVLKVDTVLAYNVGYRYQVECHVVLPADMPLKQSHDIGEGLEKKIECLDWVEMAFVHADYEFTHKPEHKYRNRYLNTNSVNPDSENLETIKAAASLEVASMIKETGGEDKPNHSNMNIQLAEGSSFITQPSSPSPVNIIQNDSSFPVTFSPSP